MTESTIIRRTAPYVCENCGAVEQQGMPTRGSVYVHYSNPVGDKLWTKKQDVCLPCGGKMHQPWILHSFQATYALLNWARLRNSFLYDHYRSIKLYEFRDGGRSPWAFAIVVNGDYQDIREGHLRSWIQDGHVPRKIKVAELRAAAQIEWDRGAAQSMEKYNPGSVDDMKAALANAADDQLPDRDSSNH